MGVSVDEKLELIDGEKRIPIEDDFEIVKKQSIWLSVRLPECGWNIVLNGNVRKAKEMANAHSAICVTKILNDSDFTVKNLTLNYD